jgi:hypothetical protein
MICERRFQNKLGDKIKEHHWFFTILFNFIPLKSVLWLSNMLVVLREKEVKS